MSDAPIGFVPGGSSDRLQAMRAPARTASGAAQTARQTMRIELLIGVVLILGGIAFALYVGRGPDTAAVTDVPGAAATIPSPSESSGSVLLAGEVAVAFAVDEGNYPPSLKQGDVVRLVVTPNLDGSGEVRGLTEKTIVMAVDSSPDNGNKTVVTVRVPESLATTIAGSGPIHVAILGGAES